MAEKRVWVGSVGPSLYDDTDIYGSGLDPADPEYDTTTLRGIRTTGQMIVEQAPTVANEVLRLSDLLALLTHTAVAGDGTIAVGDLVTLSSSGWLKAWSKVDSRVAHGVVTAIAGSSYSVQLLGVVTLAVVADDYPIGAPLYLSDTPGKASQAPASDGTIQYIGFKIASGAAGFASAMLNPVPTILRDTP